LAKSETTSERGWKHVGGGSGNSFSPPAQMAIPGLRVPKVSRISTRTRLVLVLARRPGPPISRALIIVHHSTPRPTCWPRPRSSCGARPPRGSSWPAHVCPGGWVGWAAGTRGPQGFPGPNPTASVCVRLPALPCAPPTIAPPTIALSLPALPCAPPLAHPPSRSPCPPCRPWPWPPARPRPPRPRRPWPPPAKEKGGGSSEERS
jgi:hypothetical protein